jgi:pyruvate,water dikinase
MLGEELAPEAVAKSSAKALVTGRCASKGKATGIVHIVTPDKLETTKLPKDAVLVCTMTTPDYLPLMKQAVAIVTDLGGILSHAAIVARELKIPCITGAKNATTVLKNGQEVVVDATQGTVVAA